MIPGALFHRCISCGRWFPNTRRSARYCSDPLCRKAQRREWNEQHPEQNRLYRRRYEYKQKQHSAQKVAP